MGCTRSFWLPTQGWPAPPHHPQPIRRPENNRCPSSHPQPHRVQSLAPQAAPPPLPAAQMLRSQLQLRADPGPLEDAGPLAFAYSPPPAPVTSTTRPSNLNGDAISLACSDTHTRGELLEFRLRDKEDRRTGWGRTATTCQFLRRREMPEFSKCACAAIPWNSGKCNPACLQSRREPAQEAWLERARSAAVSNGSCWDLCSKMIDSPNFIHTFIHRFVIHSTSVFWI